MDLGLFTSLGSPSIPSTTTLVRTSGYSAPGRGNADYAYDSTLTSSYVTANPRTSFLDASGRVFRLAETERTPQMFGAVGDGTTDDSVPLQAFLDDAIDATNAKRNRYDFSGTFAVSVPIYAAYPSDDNVRRFQAGRIVVLPQQTPIGDVLTITGTMQVWEGELSVVDGGNGGTHYDQRRFRTGVRFMQVGESRFEAIRVDGAKRDGVNFDGEIEPWTVRAGTPQERSSTSKNNIGLQVGLIYARGCGSCHLSGGLGHSLTISNITQGGDDAPFVANPGAYGGSHLQRSKLNVGSTAELAVYDMGRVRLEIPASTYTSLSFDATNGKIVWTAGDPVAAGLQLGDKLTLDDSTNVSVNDGQVYEILGFGGTSNREISVYPKPSTTESNKAVARLLTQFSYHAIMKVESASEILVYPWVPSRSNSKWYSMHGNVANVHGGDTANIRIGYLGGLLVGCGLRSAGLYGTKVETLLTDWAEIGILQGVPPLSVNLGTVVDHIHTEATEVNILQASFNAWALDVKGVSNLFLERIVPLNVRTGPTSAQQAGNSMFCAHIGYGGRSLDYSVHGQHSGNNWFVAGSELTNSPSHSDAQLTAAGGTVGLDYDFDMGRLFGLNRAELFWIGTNGAAPTGTLTFQLSDKLTQMGFSIVGPTSVTAPAKPCFFKVRFYPEGKKVFVTRFDAV
jgi:hypothetical protein